MKALLLPWNLFSRFRLDPAFASRLAGRVETLAVDGYDEEEFKHVWKAARPQLPNLKRLSLVVSLDTETSISEIIDMESSISMIIDDNTADDDANEVEWDLTEDPYDIGQLVVRPTFPDHQPISK